MPLASFSVDFVHGSFLSLTLARCLKWIKNVVHTITKFKGRVEE
jgi:hypothetical protein